MSVELSQFFQAFFEESFEGLDNMEGGLLNLNTGTADSETINTIFRAAHSIKGGAATFGFLEVSAFTHVMETLLDQMRSGERMVTPEAVDLLLQSVDTLRNMLKAIHESRAVDSAAVAVVQQKLTVLLNGSNAIQPQASKENKPSLAPAAKTPVEPGGWRIKFKPHEHLLRTGNDPVRILKALHSLGAASVVADVSGAPNFNEIEPTAAYLSWKIELVGDVDKKQIEEVFEWVTDDCDLFIEAIGGNSPVVKPAVDPAANISQETLTQPVPPVMSSATKNQATIPAQVAGTVAVATAVAAESQKRTGATDHGSIRVSIDKVDALINMVGELVITQSMLGQIGENFDIARLEKLRDGLSQLERNTRELQESVMRIRMLPISFAFQRFPRMARDLSQKLGKQVELQMYGEQTELDKTVMEKIGDPLVHLVRNSIDHGIEKPEIRQAAGKSPVGVVKLNAYHQGGNIVIEIADDGAGINREKVAAKAKERGLISDDRVLSDEEVYDLLFEPGFSTADQVSDVSGRGVGMDVVRRNIRELGGNVEVRSILGQGSRFTIRLPLTLAILDGQLIRVTDQTYIVPLVSIIESIQVKLPHVSAIAGKAELYKLRDEYIPIVRLYDVFGIKPISQNLTDGLLVVVEGDGQRAALFVDDLLGQQQVVIKSLETNFRRIDGVSGATILGDGKVALILDIAGLIKLSHQPDRFAHGRGAANRSEKLESFAETKAA